MSTDSTYTRWRFDVEFITDKILKPQLLKQMTVDSFLFLFFKDGKVNKAILAMLISISNLHSLNYLIYFTILKNNNKNSQQSSA